MAVRFFLCDFTLDSLPAGVDSDFSDHSLVRTLAGSDTAAAVEQTAPVCGSVLVLFTPRTSLIIFPPVGSQSIFFSNLFLLSFV